MTAERPMDNTGEGLMSQASQTNDYFALIKRLVKKRHNTDNQEEIDALYTKVFDEIIENKGKPVALVKFGTSGWRGILGKDIFCKSIAQVTMAIVEMYGALKENKTLADILGVSDLQEVRNRGCVVGFDNRFGGEILAATVVDVLTRSGIKVFYAGESTTGALSAAVLQLNAAFSVNLTPSHNPLEYGGYKFNAADAGPAASEITEYITAAARKIIESNQAPALSHSPIEKKSTNVHRIDSFALWQKMVSDNKDVHGLDYGAIVGAFMEQGDMAVVIDSVHGASRLHIADMFKGYEADNLVHLRAKKDVTFGGVAPEPSSENIQQVVIELKKRPERLKLGAIIDPDGDRIRFTDGTMEISMNQFGAMAYHFIHEIKQKKGMVAKTVATSNFANCLAEQFHEDVFEPRVGFKEFKPVIGKALVCFEESDGISIIGHTPEKDAYIGLLLALDMMMTTGKNLGEYLTDIEKQYGSYYPQRDGVEVSLQGEKLLDALAGLQKYGVGAEVQIGLERKRITRVIDIDGRKMIFNDGSWLMIRPSGTEPKVRFYVESRTADGTDNLVDLAKYMLREVGLM